MAQIVDSSDEKVFRIREFLGLNESPDGDTKLKLGEASVMRNFKITRDHSLQKRPGFSQISTLFDNYEIKVEDLSSVVRTDNNVSSQLTMYPFCELNESSQIDLYGNAVSVEFEGSARYSGYYWKGPDGNCYKFDRCEKKENGTSIFYYWYMNGMSVVPGEEATVPIKGLWNGYVNGQRVLVGATNSSVWLLWNEEEGFLSRKIGDINIKTDDNNSYVSFCDFQNKLYVFTGVSQYSWDGEGSLEEVTYSNTYVPLVAISIPPGQFASGGETLQSENLLSSRIRVWLSPDDSGDTTFLLPGDIPYDNHGIVVTNRSNGSKITDFLLLPNAGETKVRGITFETQPAPGENSIEVEYNGTGRATDGSGFYSSSGAVLSGMNLFETYNGVTDSRIFLYGNGTNKIYYSDYDLNGVPRADYFPALNVISIGAENSPVTGLIRHYSRLIAFKENETYSIQYGTITLPDNTSTAAFYCSPVNRQIGNESFGQVRLVLNSPFTLFGSDVYEWKNGSSYSSNLTIDERQAKRISDRIYDTLANFDLSRCYCYDDNDHQEYYICYNKKALVYNYAADAWYYYTDFDVTCMVNLNGELYAGDSLGRLNLVSRNNRTDNGTEITGYWESGAEPFDREFMRKYSAIQWIVLKPELRSRVEVTVQTDRKSDHAQKVAAASLFSFGDADFRRWSFNTNRKPHSERLKIKAKKFVYYKLIFQFGGTNTTATVVAADMRIRYTGYAR